jgi:23S rRNA pseudouridine1911/1915/1917 synthase
MNIPILFEDQHILVINKPSGLVVHPFDFSDEPTLLDFLHTHIPESFSINNSITLQDKRIIALGGIVHKLDRDTSGVMVVAKDQVTFDELQKKFKRVDDATTIKKVYIALVEGLIEKETFIIDAPLGREKKGYKQVVNPKNPRGELRDAITEVRIIQRNASTTLVELHPITGRTHQLRAHMASIDHPIVGDISYGSSIKAPRIMLHAETLSFVINEKEYNLKAEVPKEFLL